MKNKWEELLSLGDLDRGIVRGALVARMNNMALSVVSARKIARKIAGSCRVCPPSLERALSTVVLVAKTTTPPTRKAMAARKRPILSS